MKNKIYKKAKDIFLHYNGRYYQMEREGVYLEYKKYKIPKYYEMKWRIERVLFLLNKIKNEDKIDVLLNKYLSLIMLISNLDNIKILRKIYVQMRKDFYKMDMLSKVVIIETIYNEIDTKTLFNEISVLKKMLKKLLICTKNTKIISDYFKDENGEYLYNLTELEIQKRYDDILKKLSE